MHFQEAFAGLTVAQTYRPRVPANEYPTLDTHPKSANDMLIEACAQDPPEVWDETKYEMDEDELQDNDHSSFPSGATLCLYSNIFGAEWCIK